MHYASNVQAQTKQSEVKVAVISDRMSSEEAKRQQFQENVTLALLGLSALALWAV